MGGGGGRERERELKGEGDGRKFLILASRQPFRVTSVRKERGGDRERERGRESVGGRGD